MDIITTLDILFLVILIFLDLYLFTQINPCYQILATNLILNLIMGFMIRRIIKYILFNQGIMGANRTALNRAIKEGKYELAEKLITSQSNPENLNDGSMTHALSTGKGLYRARPRNLRIVRLLLEKGASPNFRSPNVLDLPSVSAFEVAINYYLTLLKYQDST